MSKNGNEQEIQEIQEIQPFGGRKKKQSNSEKFKAVPEVKRPARRTKPPAKYESAKEMPKEAKKATTPTPEKPVLPKMVPMKELRKVAEANVSSGKSTESDAEENRNPSRNEKDQDFQKEGSPVEPLDNFEKAVQLLTERKQTLVIRFQGDNIVALKSALEFDVDPIYPDVLTRFSIAADGFSHYDRILTSYNGRPYPAEILAVCNSVSQASSVKDKLERSWEKSAPTTSTEANKKETQALQRNTAVANGGIRAVPPEPASSMRKIPERVAAGAFGQSVATASLKSGEKKQGFPGLSLNEKQSAGSKNVDDSSAPPNKEEHDQDAKRRHKKKRKRDSSSSSSSDSEESSKRSRAKRKRHAEERERKQRKKHKKRRSRSPQPLSSSGSSSDLLPKKPPTGKGYPYLVQCEKKRELAPYTGVYIEYPHLQSLVSRWKSKANLACNLAAFLLGGEEGVQRFLAEKKPSPRAGISKMHPKLVAAIGHFLGQLPEAKCPGKPPQSLGQTIGSYFSKFRVMMRKQPAEEAEEGGGRRRLTERIMAGNPCILRRAFTRWI
ncbi:uncharacterized protein LOC129600246 [Paramacrobiotus metropolitanus]|uniref:uncharacterized protein LOC129600246 n=1 Tax=Paramacrobiotus metropolitanus TaxID=2943436 RepID=UPI0024463BBE|nr:uncharacterized protein LOC129600246 [Paramacrobiotus metropolitanus]